MWRHDTEYRVVMLILTPIHSPEEISKISLEPVLDEAADEKIRERVKRI